MPIGNANASAITTQLDRNKQQQRPQAMTTAAVQVLTSSALFSSVVAFIDGVPQHVLQFQRSEAAATLTNLIVRGFLTAPVPPALDDMALRRGDYWFIAGHLHPLRSSRLWEAAIRRSNRPVLEALDALAKTPRYKDSPHVQLANVLGFAIAHASDLPFLEWLYARFCNTDHRAISEEQLEALVIRSIIHNDDAAAAASRNNAVTAIKWLHEHDYSFPASMMDAAAASGNFDLIRFLHEHSTNGCTTRAMDIAAFYGHLEVVKFLHTHRSEGCTRNAMGGALENGHLAVLQFLHEHYSEVGCASWSIDIAAANGQVDCIAFAHTHGFVGFSITTMSEAMVYGCFDVVKYLHEHRPNDGCMVEALFAAEERGYCNIVDYLCRYRPMAKPRDASSQASRRGLTRLAAKLARGVLTSTWKKQTYFYGKGGDPVARGPKISRC